MDFALTEEQQMIQDAARDFAQNEIKPIALDLDARPNWEDRIPWEVLKKGSKTLALCSSFMPGPLSVTSIRAILSSLLSFNVISGG